MATTLKSFIDVKKDLRQMFMDRGWGIEIEGETLPYYKVYTTMLEFINEQFYGGIIQKEEVKPKVSKPVIVHVEYKCPKCGSRWVYYKKTANEYKCRKCRNIWKSVEGRILPPPKPKPDMGYYFKCETCGKKRALFRARTKDYRCRECGHTWKK